MDTKRKGLIAALALGLISGPAVALGAAGVFTAEAAAGAVAAPAPAPVVITTEATAEVGAADLDLQTACLVDGQGLVAAEADGTITDVEQAALEALRDICGAAGLALADALMPEAEEVVIVQTVTVSASAAGQGGDDPADGYEDHEDEDGDEYEDEEDDDEHEDEHEDEEDDDEHEDEDEDEDEGEDEDEDEEDE